MKSNSNIDLAGNELQNAAIHNLSTAPTDPAVGQLYFNTSDSTTYQWTGTAWVPMKGGGYGWKVIETNIDFNGYRVDLEDNSNFVLKIGQDYYSTGVYILIDKGSKTDGNYHNDFLIINNSANTTNFNYRYSYGGTIVEFHGEISKEIYPNDILFVSVSTIYDSVNDKFDSYVEYRNKFDVLKIKSYATGRDELGNYTFAMIFQPTDEDASIEHINVLMNNYANITPILNISNVPGEHGTARYEFENGEFVRNEIYDDRIIQRKFEVVGDSAGIAIWAFTKKEILLKNSVGRRTFATLPATMSLNVAELTNNIQKSHKELVFISGYMWDILDVEIDNSGITDNEWEIELHIVNYYGGSGRTGTIKLTFSNTTNYSVKGATSYTFNPKESVILHITGTKFKDGTREIIFIEKK